MTPPPVRSPDKMWRRRNDPSPGQISGQDMEEEK